MIKMRENIVVRVSIPCWTKGRVFFTRYCACIMLVVQASGCWICGREEVVLPLQVLRLLSTSRLPVPAVALGADCPLRRRGQWASGRQRRHNKVQVGPWQCDRARWGPDRRIASQSSQSSQWPLPICFVSINHPTALFGTVNHATTREQLPPRAPSTRLPESRTRPHKFSAATRALPIWLTMGSPAQREPACSSTRLFQPGRYSSR